MRHTGANDAAFPIDPEAESDCYGMTMREWYAGQALSGLLAAHATANVDLPDSDRAAKWAFSYADAMLAEARKDRTKGEGS